jgi:hypothetical protein
MGKIAIITITLVSEAKTTGNRQIEKEISNSLQCDWLQKPRKITVHTLNPSKTIRYSK